MNFGPQTPGGTRRTSLVLELKVKQLSVQIHTLASPQGN
jgi:hypothetical protein